MMLSNSLTFISLQFWFLFEVELVDDPAHPFPSGTAQISMNSSGGSWHREWYQVGEDLSLQNGSRVTGAPSDSTHQVRRDGIDENERLRWV